MFLNIHLVCGKIYFAHITLQSCENLALMLIVLDWALKRFLSHLSPAASSQIVLLDFYSRRDLFLIWYRLCRKEATAYAHCPL